MQTQLRLQDFASSMRLAPPLARKLQKCAQLGFDLNGGVSLAATLDTPEVSNTLREEVLEFTVGSKLKVCMMTSVGCQVLLNVHCYCIVNLQGDAAAACASCWVGSRTAVWTYILSGSVLGSVT
jgi:hypothetical protein